MYDLEGVLGPSVIEFVERYVDSLLAWDIVVFFQRNPDAVLDGATLAARLGRRTEEVEAEATTLVERELLAFEDGRFVYRPDAKCREQATQFTNACSDRNKRLALIALVLHRIGTAQNGASELL